MAEKHKSKYKTPKDLEKSQKPKSRKDLKDYTVDDKDGKSNPKSTGEKQSNVLRKTDKAMQDDGTYDVKYNADDRLYKDLEDGEYDVKHAAKILKKRQDNEEKEVKDVLKDKVENLTREQKERLVREYIRRTIVKQLIEQEEKEVPEEAPEEETPDAAAPAGETPAVTPPSTTEPATTEPAPAAPEEPVAPTPEPPAEETPEDKAKEKIAKEKLALKYWEETLSDQNGPNMLVDTGFDPLGKAMANLGAKDLKVAKVLILRRLAKIKPSSTNTEKLTK